MKSRECQYEEVHTSLWMGSLNASVDDNNEMPQCIC